LSRVIHPPVAVILIGLFVPPLLFTGCRANTGPGPAGIPHANVAEGARIFKDMCVICHGPEGRGDGPQARILSPEPQDFTNRAYMETKTDEELIDVTRDGRGPMPGFGDELTEQQIRDVVAYIRTMPE
jgi:mono/diheme cytochrome c family protein